MDQATGLRRLVMQTASHAGADAAPRLLAVNGGTGGVGVTTLSVNLAVALAGQGHKTALVDMGLYQSGVAALCGLKMGGSVADVLAARREIREVLQPGPAGIQVVPGLSTSRDPSDFRPAACQRLLRQIDGLADAIDVVVVDAGNGSSDVVRRLWDAADEVVLVTSCDSISLMDSYATVKRIAGGGDPFAVRLVVNRAEDELTAQDVHRRIDASMRRFLGFGVDPLGFVPSDDRIQASALLGTPLLLHAPDCPAACAFVRIAGRLMAAGTSVETDEPRPQRTAAQQAKIGKTTELQPRFSPIG